MSLECPSSTSEDKRLAPRGLEHGGHIPQRITPGVGGVWGGGSSFIHPDLRSGSTSARTEAENEL